MAEFDDTDTATGPAEERTAAADATAQATDADAGTTADASTTAGAANAAAGPAATADWGTSTDTGAAGRSTTAAGMASAGAAVDAGAAARAAGDGGAVAWDVPGVWPDQPAAAIPDDGSEDPTLDPVDAGADDRGVAGAGGQTGGRASSTAAAQSPGAGAVGAERDDPGGAGAAGSDAAGGDPAGDLLVGLSGCPAQIAALVAAICAVPASPKQLPAAVVADGMTALARAYRLLGGRVSAWSARAEAIDAVPTGARTVLTREGLPKTQSRVYVAAGRIAARHPALGELLATGRVGVHVVAAIADGTKTLTDEQTGEVITALLDSLPELTVNDVRQFCEIATDALTPDEDRDAQEQRDWDDRFIAISTSHGSTRITGHLPALEGEAIRQALTALGQSLRRDGDRLTKGQRNADALITLVNQAATHADLPATNAGLPVAATITIGLNEASRIAATTSDTTSDGATGSNAAGTNGLWDTDPGTGAGAGADGLWGASSGPGTSGDRTDLEPFAHDLAAEPGGHAPSDYDPDRDPASEAGAPVGLFEALRRRGFPSRLGHVAAQPATLRDAATRFILCTGALTGVLVHDPTPDADPLTRALGLTRLEPLDCGRTHRSATPAQRIALALRDKGCVIPGCQRPPQECQPHHVHGWAHGGPTTIDNLALLCWTHHREVDLHRWTLTRNPNPTGPYWQVTPTPRHTWTKPTPRTAGTTARTTAPARATATGTNRPTSAATASPTSGTGTGTGTNGTTATGRGQATSGTNGTGGARTPTTDCLDRGTPPDRTPDTSRRQPGARTPR